MRAQRVLPLLARAELRGQDRYAREEGRAAGRVRRREQGLGALRLSLTPRVASPSDTR